MLSRDDLHEAVLDLRLLANEVNKVRQFSFTAKQSEGMRFEFMISENRIYESKDVRVANLRVWDLKVVDV